MTRSERNFTLGYDSPSTRPGTPKFLQRKVATSLDQPGGSRHDFRVLGMMANESQVAAEVVFDATLPDGTRVRDEEMHLLNFNPQGKVIRFRHYVDTAKHIAAAKS